MIGSFSQLHSLNSLDQKRGELDDLAKELRDDAELHNLCGQQEDREPVR